MSFHTTGILLLTLAVVYDFLIHNGGVRDDLICGILAFAGIVCIIYFG